MRGGEEEGMMFTQQGVHRLTEDSMLLKLSYEGRGQGGVRHRAAYA